MKQFITALTFVLALWITPSAAQEVAVYVNSVAVADGALNAGIGYVLDDTHSIHLSTSVRPWSRAELKVNKYWSLQPEYRWWNCQVYNGSFWGVYTQGAQFNVGGKSYPLGFASEVADHRYDGWLVGAGVCYGYSWILNQNWNIEASIGAGYDYIDYQKYACPRLCAKIIEDSNHHYLGLNKLSISIVYLF